MGVEIPEWVLIAVALAFVLLAAWKVWCHLQMSLYRSQFCTFPSILSVVCVYSPYSSSRHVHDKDADTAEPSIPTLFWVQVAPTAQAELTDSVNLEGKLVEVTNARAWALLNYASIIRLYNNWSPTVLHHHVRV